MQLLNQHSWVPDSMPTNQNISNLEPASPNFDHIQYSGRNFPQASGFHTASNDINSSGYQGSVVQLPNRWEITTSEMMTSRELVDSASVDVLANYFPGAPPQSLIPLPWVSFNSDFNLRSLSSSRTLVAVPNSIRRISDDQNYKHIPVCRFCDQPLVADGLDCSTRSIRDHVRDCQRLQPEPACLAMGCARYKSFSRIDNLIQHLRGVHRWEIAKPNENY